MRKKFDNETLIETIKNKSSYKDVAIHLGVTRETIVKWVNLLNIDTSHFEIEKCIMSQITKDKISKGRKKFLKENPSKHNWSAYHKQETKPEKIFKEALLGLSISAIQYYMPPENDRRYELDFAIPEQKIAFEINGNQHYGEDNNLLPYYEARHNYFVEKGWKIHEIHYSECLFLNKCMELIKNCIPMQQSYNTSAQVIAHRPLMKIKKEMFDLQVQDIVIRNRASLIWSKILLGEKDTRRKRSKKIKSNKPYIQKGIPKLNIRKVVRPCKDELLTLIWQQSTTKISKKYNVSDKAIDKWCRTYNIPKPPRGYWMKSNYEQEEIKKQLFEKFNIK